MAQPHRIICTVTNDLTYDQRMRRICRTLSEAGYEVWLVGRELPHSIALDEMPFRQIRLLCRWRKGFAFYAEFNVRLFFFLLKNRFDAVGVVDTDTLAAGTLASLLKNKKRVFDAHEYFTEVPEVVNRRWVRAFWAGVERLFLPFYRHAYTVGPALAHIFTQKHDISFHVVRNVPVQLPPPPPFISDTKILLYQGALNEGRGIEAAIAAMRLLPDGFELHLAGEGDLSDTLREMARDLGDKVRFLGYLRPDDLRVRTRMAWLGINLLENKGQSYYFSLANKFFDYVQARVPVLTMNFPEYAALNQEFPVAILLNDLSPDLIAETIKHLAEDEPTRKKLISACDAAASVWNWEQEAQVLVRVWEAALGKA